MFEDCSDLRVFVNDFIIVSVFNVCVYVGYFRLGVFVYGYVVKIGFSSDVFVGSFFVDLYFKCEELYSVRCVFD